jgi:hypothetical protein
MSVFVHIDSSKPVGAPDQIKIFANAEVAAAWFAENDPEGVAFEKPGFVLKRPPPGVH